MTANFALASIKSASTGSTTSRTFGDRWSDILNVKDYGATGNGTTDDTTFIQAALDAAFGTTASPHGGSTNVYLNRPVFFPAGKYKITAPLTIRSLRGGHVFGAGRFVTQVVQVTANTSVFVTNGCEYSVFERMHLTANGTGTCFDLDWDNTGTAALQSNTFRDLYLENGDYGLRIANTGYQGSENLILNCFFSGQSVGLYATSQNCLQNTVIGGNFQSCTTAGIKTNQASVPLISGVGFQNNVTAYDIILSPATGQDTTFITSCRIESLNFLSADASAPLVVMACGQTNASAGDFASIIGCVTIDNCSSVNGRIVSPTNNSAALMGRNNRFQRAGYLVQNQMSISQAISGGFDGSRLLTNSSGVQTGATFASLPTAHATVVGAMALVVDSTTATVGNTITGGGSNVVMAVCNSAGPAWKVLFAL